LPTSLTHPRYGTVQAVPGGVRAAQREAAPRRK
jgi:hypothetical protein